MDSAGIFDAETALSALLDHVERGQELVITRKGKAVARLLPAIDEHRPQAAAAELRSLRAAIAARGETFEQSELNGYRDHGRR